MTQQINHDLLSKLFAQVERAWLDNHDDKLVYRLSEQYPEFRRQLHEFFEDMLIEQEPTAEMIEAEDRVDQWLRSSGINIAITAAAQARSSPVTSDDASNETASMKQEPQKQPHGKSTSTQTAANWLVFLRERTKQTLPNLTRPLQHVSTEYLVLLSRHPNIVPQKAKAQIAEDIERIWGVPVNESFHYLSQAPSVLRAASRSRPFEKEPQTFEELLDRSALTPEQKAFWRQYSSSSE
jgi:hypothetical protein